MRKIGGSDLISATLCSRNTCDDEKNERMSSAFNVRCCRL